MANIKESLHSNCDEYTLVQWINTILFIYLLAGEL